MVQDPLQNIQHQFKHLPNGDAIESFLKALFDNDNLPPRFNEFFDIQSYGYVIHPGGYFFHTLILKFNPLTYQKGPFELTSILQNLPHEVDEDVYLFWSYSFGILHITITGSN